VTTLAGLAGFPDSTDGPGPAARFNLPNSVAVDSIGAVFVADCSNHTIRKITAAGAVTTLAGLAGSAGSTDGTGVAARFNLPCSVAVDGTGNVFVADYNNHVIRRIAAGAVTTLAGLAPTPSGSADGIGPVARFNAPQGVSSDEKGNLYVADTANHVIRKITATGVVTTLAGLAGFPDSTDGLGPAARFDHPSGVTVDSAGNVYVADTDKHTIRKVTAAGAVTTLAGVSGSPGSTDGTGAAARFYLPYGIAMDGPGNVYVADTGNHTIRRISAAGEVTTLAGTAGLTGSADGTGAAARFDHPQGISVDSSGNVYVADTDNHIIRKITATGVVTTLAGKAGSYGLVDGAGAAMRFYHPQGISVDSVGNVYVADAGNNTIRKVTAAGAVTTVVGMAGTKGIVPGPLPAGLSSPRAVAIDQTTGYLFISAENALLRVRL
jgi:sugar lactone lactonase YvrE